MASFHNISSYTEAVNYSACCRSRYFLPHDAIAKWSNALWWSSLYFVRPSRCVCVGWLRKWRLRLRRVHATANSLTWTQLLQYVEYCSATDTMCTANAHGTVSYSFRLNCVVGWPALEQFTQVLGLLGLFSRAITMLSCFDLTLDRVHLWTTCNMQHGDAYSNSCSTLRCTKLVTRETSNLCP